MGHSNTKGWSLDPTSIGIVSQVWGDVSPAAVQCAVHLQQQQPGKKLGEALIECGAVQPEQLDHLLEKQKQMRQEPRRREDVERMLDFATERTRSAADTLGEILADLR